MSAGDEAGSGKLASRDPSPGAPTHGDLVLGVDGGGSKTAAWLARCDDSEEPVVLGRGAAAGSNVRTGGITAALSSLNLAIDDAFSDAGINRGRVASACLGVAGTDREAERAAVERWARAAGIAERVTVTNDALPVLYAAAADGCGIALIAGTGSLALGRDLHGTVVRSGGWGPLFGDEGSGYRIALAGLRSAARFADGRGPETALLRSYLRRLSLRESSELIPAIYSEQVDRAWIAETAELVFTVAEQGDPVAASIVKGASDELAEMVIAVARQLKRTEAPIPELSIPGVPIPLGLSGGVLLNQPALRQHLLEALTGAGVTIAPATRVPHPVAGALRMAAAHR